MKPDEQISNHFLRLRSPIMSDGVLEAVNCHKSLAHNLAKETEAILVVEITARIGDGWMIPDLRGRLLSVQICGEPQETIMLDGKPLVELWPIELETLNTDGKITISLTRRYSIFRSLNKPILPTTSNQSIKSI